MAVFRIEKTRDYTVMSNYHLRDMSLSLKAKGLLSLMLSLPENWDYTMKGLARICKDGIDSISCLIPGFFLLCAPGFDCCAIRLEVDFRNRPPIFLRSFRHIHSPYYILLFTSFSRICPISSLC